MPDKEPTKTEKQLESELRKLESLILKRKHLQDDIYRCRVRVNELMEKNSKEKLSMGKRRKGM